MGRLPNRYFTRTPLYRQISQRNEGRGFGDPLGSCVVGAIYFSRQAPRTPPSPEEQGEIYDKGMKFIEENASSRPVLGGVYQGLLSSRTFLSWSGMQLWDYDWRIPPQRKMPDYVHYQALRLGYESIDRLLERFSLELLQKVSLPHHTQSSVRDINWFLKNHPPRVLALHLYCI